MPESYFTGFMRSLSEASDAVRRYASSVFNPVGDGTPPATPYGMGNYNQSTSLPGRDRRLSGPSLVRGPVTPPPPRFVIPPGIVRAMTPEIEPWTGRMLNYGAGNEIPLPAKETLTTPEDIAGAMGIFGKGLTILPEQVKAAVLKGTQGAKGASVVDRDWVDRYSADAQNDINKFVEEVTAKYGEKQFLPGLKITELASLPQNLAYSLASMGVGVTVGAPAAIFLSPQVAAVIGAAASGVMAYNMTAYEITQQYLEVKDAEKRDRTGKGLTLTEENELKGDFANKARKYGLLEAIPEAISNLAIVGILTAPLGRMVGQTMAGKVLSKVASLYGEELLTEVITQKGQSIIEVEAGLRENNITWWEALKEVAPQTFLLTTLMAGAGATVIGGKTFIDKATTSLKNEIGEGHPLYNGLIEEIKDEVTKYIGGYQPQIVPEGEGQPHPSTKDEAITSPLPEHIISRQKYLQILKDELARIDNLGEEELIKELQYRGLSEAAKQTGQSLRDARFKAELSTWTKYSLKKGETWRSRFARVIASEEKTIREKMAELPLTPPEENLQPEVAKESQLTPDADVMPPSTSGQTGFYLEKEPVETPPTEVAEPPQKPPPPTPPTAEEAMPEPSDNDKESQRVLAEFEKIHEYYRTKMRNEAETKQSLVDFAKKLPLEVKGKLLNAVKNVRTPEQLTKALDYIGRLMEDYEGKVLKAAIKKELVKTSAKRRGGHLVGKFTADVQQKLDVIRKYSRMNPAAIEAQIAQNMDNMDNGLLDDEAGAEENALLKMSNLKTMNNTELRTVLDSIRNLKTKGRTEILERRMAARKERIGFETIKEAVTALRKQMMPDIGTQIGRAVGVEIKGKVGEILTGKPTQRVRIITGDKTLAQKINQMKDDFFVINDMLEPYIESLDSYESKGLFQQVIWNSMQKARNEQMTLQNELYEMIDKYVKDNKINLSKILTRKVQIGDSLLNGEQRTGIVLAYKDQQARPHTEFGSKVTPDDAMQAEASLNEDERKYMALPSQIFDKGYELESKTHELMYGVKLDKRPDYFAIYTLTAEAGGEVGLTEYAEQQNLLHNKSLLPSQRVNDSHRMKTVKGAKQPLLLNISSVLMNYIHETTWDYSYSLIARDLQTILLNRDFARPFKQANGNASYQNMLSWLEKSVSTYPMRIQNHAEGILRTVRQNAASWALAFNALSGMRAGVSWWDGAAFVGGLNALQGTISNIADHAGTVELQKKYSPQARARVAMRELAEMKLKRKLAHRNTLSPNEFKAIFYIVADKFTVDSIWRAAYGAQIRLNPRIDPHEAAAYADKAMRETQPVFDMQDAPAIFTSGEGWRWLTMFTTQPNRKWNYMKFNVIGKLRAGKISLWQAAYQTAKGYIIPSIILYMIAKGRPPKDAKEWALAGSLEFIHMLPVVGTYISAGMLGYALATGLGTEIFQQIQETAYHANKKQWDKVAVDIGTGVSVGTGLPSNPVKKIWEAAQAIVNKDVNPLRTLIYGEWKAKQIEKEINEIEQPRKKGTGAESKTAQRLRELKERMKEQGIELSEIVSKKEQVKPPSGPFNIGGLTIDEILNRIKKGNQQEAGGEREAIAKKRKERADEIRRRQLEEQKVGAR